MTHMTAHAAWQRYDAALNAWSADPNDHRDEHIVRRDWFVAHWRPPQVVAVTAQDYHDAWYATAPSPASTFNVRIADNINARLRARAGTTDTIPVRVVRRPTETVTAFRTPREEGVRDEVHVCVEYTSGKFSMQTAVALSEYLTNGLRRDVVRWCVPGQPWHESAVTQTPRAWAADDCEAMVGRRVLMLDRTGNYAAFIHPEDDAADYVDYAVQFNAAECYILPPTEAA